MPFLQSRVELQAVPVLVVPARPGRARLLIQNIGAGDGWLAVAPTGADALPGRGFRLAAHCGSIELTQLAPDTAAPDGEVWASGVGAVFVVIEG